MQIYAITPVFFALLASCVFVGLRPVLLLVGSSIPFGMAAVIGLPAVGGLSLLAVNVAAITLVGCGVLVLVSRLVHRRVVRVEPATLSLIVFAVYSAFSATILVRLFAGELMVFSLSRGVEGVRVSAVFSWPRVWLGPSTSNISQTFYVLLACGFFITSVHVLSRHGPGLGARCMAIAAGLNIALGSMDLLGLDALLSVIRTANYSLANEASVQGLPRVIGGYSEAASFGSASAMFFAFFASSHGHSRRPLDAVLALGSGIFALLALSSTGIIAMAVVCGVLVFRALIRRPTRLGRQRVIVGGAVVAVIAIGVAAVLTLTQAPDHVAAVIEDLILNKSQTSSGVERMAWAMGGLEALRDTWGLGVGTGSLRSNGLVFVLLGSVGVIGTLAFAIFLWLAFAGRAVAGQEASLSNARIAALALLVSLVLAATVPDPGVPLSLLAAIAVTSKRPQRARHKAVAAGHPSSAHSARAWAQTESLPE